MNNARYSLTFYGGVWVAGFIIFFLTPGWSWQMIVLGSCLFFLCPSWKHYFDWRLTKDLARQHMKGHLTEHAANLKRDEQNGIKH